MANNINLNISLPLEVVAALQGPDTGIPPDFSSIIHRSARNAAQSLPSDVSAKSKKRTASEIEQDANFVPSERTTKRKKSNGPDIPRSDRLKQLSGSDMPIPEPARTTNMQPTKEPKITLFIVETHGKRYPVHLEPGQATTVQGLKAAIQDVSGIPPDQQRLIFAGRELCDDRVVRDVDEDDEWREEMTIKDYHIGHEATVHMVLRLRGT